jgi:O-antigen ligase
MKPSLNVNMLQLQLVALIVLGLVFAAYVGAAIGNSDTKLVVAIIGALAAIALLLKMGGHYWLLIPIGMTSGLPALPIGGRTLELGELTMAGCFGLFLLRLAMRKDKVRISPLLFFVLLSFAWVAFIYWLNPVGFAFMGASSVGARDYQRIALGVCACLVLANQKIGNKEAKWLIAIAVIGPALGMCYAFLSHGVLGGGPAFDEDGNEYTWHQSMSSPAFALVLYMFSKYSPAQIFTPVTFGRMATVFGAMVIAFSSGKRAVVATLMLTPLISAILRRQWAHLYIYVIMAMAGVAFLVAGHGQYFELPFRVQRSLANFPGQWDPAIKSMTAEGADSFRTVMREHAWDRIKARPIIGKGIGFDLDEIAGYSTAAFGAGDATILALGNSWHNTWLGLGADFGAPAVLLHMVVFALTLYFAYCNYRNTDRTTSLGIYCMMVFIGMIFALLRSYTSGSSNIGYGFYWQVGIILGIAATLKSASRKASDPTLDPLPAKGADGRKSRGPVVWPTNQPVASAQSQSWR